MKQGRSLTDLAAELERQTKTKKDYIAPQGKLNALVAVTTDGKPAVEVGGLNGETVGITPFAHAQFADHLGIPKKYYDRMLAEKPALLVENLNEWLHDSPGEQRLVRTLDGDIRAFLSSKFRPLDNFDLANAILPTLIEKGVEITSAELTETRLYIKGILPSLSDPLPAGLAYGVGHDQIRVAGKEGRLVAAIVISNSEVGAGTLRIEPSVFTTWCTNLAIMVQAAMKKYHVGRSFEEQANFEVYRDETRQADDRAFWLKVRDVTQAAFAEDRWRAAVEEIKHAAERPIVSDNLNAVVEVAVKRLALPEASGPSILTHLARGGDLSQWGLSSAITSAANDYGDYEGATDLERAGGKVIALQPQEWKVIAEAAA